VPGKLSSPVVGRLTVVPVVLLAVVASVVGGSAPLAGAAASVAFPPAGELVNPIAVARAAPTVHARVVRTLHQFRRDFRYQVVLALRTKLSPVGERWVELSLPGRPNGGRGWVPATAVKLHPVADRILVRRGTRLLEVQRVSDGKLLLRAPVAVGKPGAETPLGRDYYVQWRFTPTDPFYGSYALQTSAYSRLSDWPGGGVVGIHGTDAPNLIGEAVSHGCIRMLNRDVVKLRALAPLGTPIDILR